MPSTNCPYCGKLTDPNLENCPHCQGQLQKAPKAAAPPRKGARQTCPNCHAMVQDGDIICVNCGTNLLTGQKIAEEKMAAAAKEKSKLPLLIAIIALGVLVLAGLIAIVVMLLTSNPVDKAVKLGKEGRSLQAADLLEDHLQSNPNDARAYFELGRLRWATNQPGLAAQSFAQAAKLDPNNRDAAMAAVVTTAGAPGEVPSQTVMDLESITNHDPSDQRAWFLLALTRGKAGNLEGQVEALEKAVGLNANDEQARLQLGIARALEGNYSEADQELASALKEQPNNPEVQEAAGLVAGLEGDTQKAVDALRAVADSGAEVSSESLTELGLLLVSQGQYADAQGYLERASKQEKPPIEAQFYLAACYRAQDRIPDALAAFDAVSKSDNPLAGAAAVRAADAYMSINDLDRAQAALDRAKSKGVDSAEYHTVRGRFFGLTNDESSAQEEFAKASQVDATYAPAHLESGLLFLQRQNAAQALKELELYVKLANPNANDSRVAEVQGLVNQLKQGAQGGPPAEPAATETGRSDA